MTNYYYLMRKAKSNHHLAIRKCKQKCNPVPGDFCQGSKDKSHMFLIIR